MTFFYKLMVTLVFLSSSFSCSAEEKEDIVELIYSGKPALKSISGDYLATITHFQAVDLVGDEEEVELLRRMVNLKHFTFGSDDASPLTPEVIQFIISREKLISLNLNLDIRESSDITFLSKIPTLRSLVISQNLFSQTIQKYSFDKKFASFLDDTGIEKLVVNGGVEDGVTEYILIHYKKLKDLQISISKVELMRCLDSFEMGRLQYFKAYCGGFEKEEINLIKKVFSQHEVKIVQQSIGVAPSVTAIVRK